MTVWFIKKKYHDNVSSRYLLLDGRRAAVWWVDHEDTEQGYTLPNPHLKHRQRETDNLSMSNFIKLMRRTFHEDRNASTHHSECDSGNEHTHTSPHAAPWGPARPFFDGMRLWISPALPRQQHVSKPWRLIFIKKVKVMEIIRLFLNRGAPRPPGEIPSPPPRMSSQINPSIRLTTSNLLKRRCWQRMQC